MGERTYQIEHDDFLITYDPSAGTVSEMKGATVVALERKNPCYGPRKADISHASPMGTFRPNCLTIYGNHQCNLRCDYCYASDKRSMPQKDITTAAVQAAAEFVAAHCRKTGRPFVLGFHGGNEPLLSRGLVEDSIACCKTVADEHELQMLSFCTTNGVVDRATAEWAARTFHGITLSWDGSQATHDKHRRDLNNRPTFETVKRTAEVFRKMNVPQVTIRVTVTRDSVNQLCESIRYFRELGFDNVQVYPVFPNGRGGPDKEVAVDQADFVFNFLKARTWARGRNMKLLFSGTRWDDYHDRFCMLNQDNLTITPDGFITACFLATHNYEEENDRYMYGRYDESSNELCIDWEKLRRLSESVHRTNPQCDNCYNQFHCAKNCPSICPLSELELESEFDCTIFKWIGLANIIEATGHVVDINTREECMDYFKSVRITSVPKNNGNERISHNN
ncbi:MAG: radical SAM protein [Ignavibacteriales bacterium]|nr:radical SAM protein [Ignavibacteriales bacterium]